MKSFGEIRGPTKRDMTGNEKRAKRRFKPIQRDFNNLIKITIEDVNIDIIRVLKLAKKRTTELHDNTTLFDAEDIINDTKSDIDTALNAFKDIVKNRKGEFRILFGEFENENRAQ